jgi:hypothetical protein
MTAWMHTECNIMDEEALIKLQEAWNNSEQKDECIVRSDDLELAFWMGTEVGQVRNVFRKQAGWAKLQECLDPRGGTEAQEPAVCTAR